jgi:hypothetical protein
LKPAQTDSSRDPISKNPITGDAHMNNKIIKKKKKRKEKSHHKKWLAEWLKVQALF